MQCRAAFIENIGLFFIQLVCWPIYNYHAKCRVAFIEKIGLFFIKLVCLLISIYHAEPSSSFFIICLFLSNSFVCLFPIIMQCIVALFEKIGLFFIQLVCLPISIYHAEHCSSFFIICLFFIQLVCLQCNVA